MKSSQSIFCILTIFVSFLSLFVFAIQGKTINAQTWPECWPLDEISYTGLRTTNRTQEVHRVSIYEIHDDDSVNPNHELTGLPYYETLSWRGSADVEWLVLEGNFSSYVINEAEQTVTFYDLSDWLHVVYRTNNFMRRTPDQLNFCVIGMGGGAGEMDIQVRVRYPANYQFQLAEPSGYSIPAAGEIRWDFGSIEEFQVNTYFAGLGPDRPLLDLPVDYAGRGTGSATRFTAAFNGRITSRFDHHYPNYSKDGKFLPFTGEELDDPPTVECRFGFNCYDGHDAYDFDDLCTSQAPCSDSAAVYAAAAGSIVPTQTGWHAELGCRITIDHGNGWATRYSHLRDSINNDADPCSGLRRSGQITSTTRIGSIGSTGSGSGGTTHLHFSVLHNSRVVDPSGWEPNRDTHPDPWEQHAFGAASYPMWLYSIRSTQAFDPDFNGDLASPTHDVVVTIPSGFYTEPLVFSLSNLPVSGRFGALTSTGHSFSLTAMDDTGSYVEDLDSSLGIEVAFSSDDIQGLDVLGVALSRETMR